MHRVGIKGEGMRLAADLAPFPRGFFLPLKRPSHPWKAQT